MTENKPPEPWLRGTLTDVLPVQRAVLHALELANEDLDRWCAGLTDEELNSRPASIVSVACHLRHISRSIDRLLTYAEGRQLSSEQAAALKSELDSQATRSELFAELADALERAATRIRAFAPNQIDEPRTVGIKKLPTTVAGLLVHVADHTQRHIGQAVTTSKLILAQRVADSL
jgi:uncharacterized damage-inducible protein DinB